MVTSCVQNVSERANFFKLSPKKCQILGQGQILKKFIGPQRIQCTASKKSWQLSQADSSLTTFGILFLS